MQNNYYSRVFGLLFVGLFISFLTGYCVSLNPELIIKMFSSTSLLFILLLEIGIVIAFNFLLSKMPTPLAYACYILYSFTTGFTLSSIFLLYNMSSIIFVFLITSILFLLLALYGYFTKRDLTKWGIYLLFALLGIMITTIVNIFIGSQNIDFVINIVGIIVFLMFTAYDVNHVLPNSNYMYGDSKGAIYAAFQIYLDYINLFLRIIQIIGKNKDN